MKSLILLALVPLFASCVPNAAKEVTRSAGDAKTLGSHALLRPKWPDPTDRPARFATVQTSVVQAGSENRGVHGSVLSDVGNLGLVLNPGPCSIRVRSGKPPYTAYGNLDFVARQGKIYRFIAKTDPAQQGRDMTHDWEVYEEDTRKVIYKKEAPVTFAPMSARLLFSRLEVPVAFEPKTRHATSFGMKPIAVRPASCPRPSCAPRSLPASLLKVDEDWLRGEPFSIVKRFGLRVLPSVDVPSTPRRRNVDTP